MPTLDGFERLKHVLSCIISPIITSPIQFLFYLEETDGKIMPKQFVKHEWEELHSYIILVHLRTP